MNLYSSLRRAAGFVLAAVAAFTVQAQTDDTATDTGISPVWNVEFESVFDNREGDSNILPTKTFFFTRLAPEGGVRFSKESSLVGGVVWTQPLGADWDEGRVRPTLYYRFDSPVWKFSMGFLPRRQLTEELPRFLWNDSLAYYDRNIQGALVQYVHTRGWAEAYIDWPGMQTRERREAFKIVAQGKWRPASNAFFMGAHLMMNHYALTLHSGPDQHIVDNFLVDPFVGVSLSRPASWLDSLEVRAGVALTVERNRANDDGWQAPYGGWLQLKGQWRWLRVENLLYAGKALLPSYAEFGSALYPGEAYFQKKFYNRTDLYLSLLHRRGVNLEAALDFNVAPGCFTFYQRLLLRIDLGN